MSVSRAQLSRRLAGAALLAVLAACSSDTNGPSDRVLVGTWGSPDAEFIAIQAGAEVRAGCSTIVIRTPVALTDANTFATQGELHGSGATIGKFPTVDVSGTVNGSRLSLVAPGEDGAPAVTYLLESGVSRPLTDQPGCPQ
jgi:hypothetical protein